MLLRFGKIALMSLIFVLCAATTSLAGSWSVSSDGWRYQNDNGSYCQNGWASIDDHWFYFDENKLMVTGWKQIDDEWYYFGDDGIMVTGWVEIDEKWYYFQEATPEETAEEAAARAEAEAAAKAAEAAAIAAGEPPVPEEEKEWYTPKIYPEGALYQNALTDDGYYLGEEGEWDETIPQINLEDEEYSESLGTAASAWAMTQIGSTYSMSKRLEHKFFDCSSLVYRSYAAFGIDISNHGDSTAAGIAKNMMLSGKVLKKGTSLKAGDLIFYSLSGDNGRFLNISHVEMYCGNKIVVAASSTKKEVVLSRKYPSSFLICRPSMNATKSVKSTYNINHAHMIDEDIFEQKKAEAEKASAESTDGQNNHGQQGNKS